MNISFMFSGQGSQYVGMCEEFYNEYPSVKELFKAATDTLGYDVKEVLFSNEEKLNNTLYTQPLMFVMYASILKVFEEHNIVSTHTLGLSLGEYGALYDSGCFSFETGVQLLDKRGKYMAEACQKTTGKMSAILGMDAKDLNGILKEVNGKVSIANYNTYGQLVISGEEHAVLKANELALQKGAKRAIILNTSGPFHTDLMRYAKEQFGAYIDQVEIREPNKKLLLNTTGDFYKGDLKEHMKNQITNSVLFYQEIETLLHDTVEIFVEIGPKKTLSSFVKKINRKVNIMNVENLESLHKTIHRLEELQCT